MSQDDELVQRFAAEPDQQITDSTPPSADEVEQQLTDHGDYQEADAHPDDEASIESVHEDYLGPPPAGVRVDEVEGGDALAREVGR